MSEVLLSQLAHVEIISPKPEESVRWFVDVLGLELTTQQGQSAYLRGWGEWLHSSLIVTEGPAPALGHIGWRPYGPGDVEAAAARTALVTPRRSRVASIRTSPKAGWRIRSATADRSASARRWAISTKSS